MRDYSVSSIKKAVEVLDYIKANPNTTFARIQSDLGYAKSSTYQILKTLEGEHLVSVSPHGEYALGFKLYAWGSAYAGSITWRSIIAPYIREIAEKTEMAVHVSVMTRELQGICIEKIPGKLYVTRSTSVGTPLQLHASATGRVLVAWQPRNVQEKILDQITYTPFTASTITSREQLEENLRLVRRQGFALDECETEENYHGVAVPLFACDGSLLGAISLGAPDILMKREQMGAFSDILLSYTRMLAPQLTPEVD